MTDRDDLVWSGEGKLVSLGMPEWLAAPALQDLMIAFENAGFKIYAVGGCVRDTVLGHPVHDVDLSTDATPDISQQIVRTLKAGGSWKAVPTGIDHGTITAVAPNGTAFEITTFRSDTETDGRHATVAFSNSIEDDAARRDFTINALYADRHGAVIDCVGGSADLKAYRVRFIGDPVARIQEDYLRILRFFRFTARLWFAGEGIDPDGLAACAEHADGLEQISKERIGSEMTRLIMEDHAAPVIGSMEHSGVLSRILPGASVLTLARLIDLEEALYKTSSDGAPRDLPTRLAALGCVDVGERLRLSKAQAKKVDLVRKEAGSLTPPHELGYRHGYPDAVHCLLLRWASLMQPIHSDSLKEARRGAGVEFPVKAQDLIPAFEGRALGDRLARLEKAWIASGFDLGKAELLALP